MAGLAAEDFDALVGGFRPNSTKHKGHGLFRVRDLCAVNSWNCSWWAKGDLNPHVPKDTGT